MGVAVTTGAVIQPLTHGEEWNLADFSIGTLEIKSMDHPTPPNPMQELNI
jgi:hypothetical protein